MKYILAGISIIFIVIISSCVFSPDKENFVELDQNVTAPVISNQTLDLDADTIYVWKTTSFNFDLRSSKQKIRSVIINYGDKSKTFSYKTGSFEIDPSSLAEGISQMEMKIITESGTGSMADIYGAEGFEFKKTWVMVVERAVAPEIHISTSIENGYLKFSWNSMDKHYIRSLRYIIDNETNNSSYDRDNIDKKITSAIEPGYIGGKLNFRFFVNYQDVRGSYHSAVENYQYEYPFSVSYKEDLDSITFSWPKSPFHYTAFYDLFSTNSVEIKGDTSYSIPSPGLGYDVRYSISFKSDDQSENSNPKLSFYPTFSFGIKDKMPHNNVEYNAHLNAYFFKQDLNILLTDKNLLSQAVYDKERSYWDSYTLAFSSDNTKLYSTVNGKLVTLDASALNVISSTSLSFSGDNIINTYVLKALNDQTMLIGYHCSDGYHFVLFNSLDGTVIDQSDKMPDDISSMGNYIMNVSPDGKYAAISYGKGLYLFEIVDNKQLILRYHDTKTCYNGLFDPKYPERLILNRVNDIALFNCSTLQIDKTISFAANPINFDPLTHNLLMVSYSKKKIYVYDYENDVIKFEMNHHGHAYDFKLINNIIFVNAGYHFDISSYVD
ncbi:MAG: hypothetical protein ACM3RX_05065 [Methanococcaceae archaeon]